MVSGVERFHCNPLHHATGPLSRTVMHHSPSASEPRPDKRATAGSTYAEWRTAAAEAEDGGATDIDWRTQSGWVTAG